MQKSFMPKPAPVLVRFERGDEVYKWTEYGFASKTKEGKDRVSEYWCPWKAVKVGPVEAPGFDEMRKRYGNIDGGVGRPQEFARARLAVKTNWNAMSAITKARFKKPVWGFLGRTKYQSLHDPREGEAPTNVLLIGG